MNHLPAFQFYTGDWKKDPQLRMASAATRGIWIDLLCSMWEATERGTISGTIGQLAQLCSCTQDEFTAFLAEAEQLKFADVQRSDGGYGIVTLTNRRMIRDEKTRKDSAIRMSRMRTRRTVTGQLRESCTVSSSSKNNKSADAPSADASVSPLQLESDQPKRLTSVASKQEQAQALFDLWNTTVTQLPKARDLTDRRVRHSCERLKKHSLDEMREVIRRFDVSDFAAGSNWATFDWVIANDDNPMKVLEGKYDKQESYTSARLNSSPNPRREPLIPTLAELHRQIETEVAPPLTPEQRAELHRMQEERRTHQLEQGAANEQR